MQCPPKPVRAKLKKFRRKSLLKKLGLMGATIGLSATFLGGCSRQQYRCKTDTEAYYLLDEKRAQSCEDEAARIRIEVDPRSRMFDPFNPDRPPMPEDDPQANQLMRCVDRKKGYPLWEANGRTNLVENPEWWNYLPLDERGVLVLDLDDAVRLALLHSPNYQSNLETMYLSALDVSIERFLLDSQFFGGTGTSFRRRGPVAAASPFGSTDVDIGSTDFQMRKLYSTGATLVADFANSLTWQIAGPDTFVSPSALSFTFIQPLLRNGGRDVALERLTLAERALLTNVRAFERYRRGFYVQIATGTGPDTSPSRQGGAFGGAGLGGFDALGSVFQNAGGGGGGFGGGNVQNANGYIGLLQDQLNIENQRENIIRLQDIYLQYQDNYRELLLTMPESQTEIPTQQLQVAQAQQQVFQAQSALLGLQAAYEGNLDQFKSLLGLPPYLCVEIKGDLLKQFELISKNLRNRRTELSQYRAAVGEENSALLNLTETKRDETGTSVRTLPANAKVQSALQDIWRQMQVLSQFLQTIQQEDLAQVRIDVKTLRDSVPKRRRQLNRLKDVAERERGMVCSLLPLGDFNTTFLEGNGLEELPDELDGETDVLDERVKSHIETLERTLATIQAAAEELDQLGSDQERFSVISEKVILGSQDLIASINETVSGIQLVQARARTEAVVLPEIDLEPRDALEIARRNRRDWLIRKAGLVDTWRRIEFVADDLESVLDVTFSGDVGNVGSNPFAFHSSTGSLRAGLVWDAPITRVQERNNYRQILIQFQQARRGFYQFEDGVWASLRSALRDIRQSQLSFEIQRFAVQNAALQISVNDDIRQINETLGQVSGPTAARDAVQGLQDFLNTQSQLIGIFSTFEARRRVLDRDLGTMQIDNEGLWIDPGPITLETVGGQTNQAISQYGLEEGEVLVPSETQIEDFNNEVRVSPAEELPMVIPGENAAAAWSPEEFTSPTVTEAPPENLQPEPESVSKKSFFRRSLVQPVSWIKGKTK